MITNKYISVLFILGCLSMVPLAGATAQGQNVAEVFRQARESGIAQFQLEELRERAYGNGLSDQELSLLLQPAVNLAERDLPYDNLMQKALEGLTKKVPVQRMIPVLNSIESANVTASGVVTSWTDHPRIQAMVRRESISPDQFRKAMIKATSRSMQQDIPPEVTSQLLNEIANSNIPEKRNPSDIISAVGIIPDLASGGNAAPFREVVIKALESGFSTGDLQKLPAAINVARQRSQLPAASVIEGVSRQMRSGVPATQVLENLFNGEVGNGPPGKIPKGLEDNLNSGNADRGGNGTGGGRGN